MRYRVFTVEIFFNLCSHVCLVNLNTCLWLCFTAAPLRDVWCWDVTEVLLRAPAPGYRISAWARVFKCICSRRNRSCSISICRMNR